MAQYIDKSALVAEIERLKAIYNDDENIHHVAKYNILVDILSIVDTLEVKEVEETMSIAYVVTRSEEHSDYVEKVFFDEDKAQEYCDQFKGNENEYARHITKVEVTL